MNQAVAVWTVWWEVGEGTRTATAPDFESACALAECVGDQAHVWEEHHEGGFYEWNDWERVDGEWWPMLGGRFPFMPARPWEGE